MTSRKPRVCIVFPLEPDLLERVEAACEVRQLGYAPSPEELHAALADADGALVHNALPVAAEFLDAGPNLRVVSGVGVGYDKFDIEEATRRGVAVCHTPDVVTPPVANLTIAMLLMLSRRLFENEAFSRGGAWARREPPVAVGVALEARTLGIVGFGRIGREVTRRIQPFGMRTLWNDVFTAQPDDAPHGEYRPLDELLRESDFVSLHVDLNPTSHHLIGARELSLMRPGAYLVNTSRGPVVDQKALTDALREARIAGAAVDVLEQEPPDPAEPLVRLPNVLTFPHIGTATEETRRAMRELAVRNLLAILGGQPPPACINPGVLA